MGVGMGQGLLKYGGLIKATMPPPVVPYVAPGGKGTNWKEGLGIGGHNTYLLGNSKPNHYLKGGQIKT